MGNWGFMVLRTVLTYFSYGITVSNLLKNCSIMVLEQLTLETLGLTFSAN